MWKLTSATFGTALSEKFAIEMSLTPYSNPKRKRGMNVLSIAASLTLFEVALFQPRSGDSIKPGAPAPGIRDDLCSSPGGATAFLSRSARCRPSGAESHFTLVSWGLRPRLYAFGTTQLRNFKTHASGYELALVKISGPKH